MAGHSYPFVISPCDHVIIHSYTIVQFMSSCDTTGLPNNMGPLIDHIHMTYTVTKIKHVVLDHMTPH